MHTANPSPNKVEKGNTIGLRTDRALYQTTLTHHIKDVTKARPAQYERPGFEFLPNIISFQLNPPDHSLDIVNIANPQINLVKYVYVQSETMRMIFPPCALPGTLLVTFELGPTPGKRCFRWPAK